MTPATPDEVRRALSGPTLWPVALEVGDRWVPPGSLSGIGERISARLGGAAPRVGESTYVLGLAARLWSATLGPWARHGVLPDPAAIVVTDDHGSVSLGLTELRGWRDVTAGELLERVLAVLRPVIEPSRLNHRLLWGNVASALAATPRVLELPAARPWVAEMLEVPPLAGEVLRGRRTTCCLFYEAGGGLCSDCVLDRIPPRGVRRGRARG